MWFINFAQLFTEHIVTDAKKKKKIISLGDREE